MRGTHSLAIQLVLVFPVAPEAPGSLGGLAFQLLLQPLAVLKAPECTKCNERQFLKCYDLLTFTSADCIKSIMFISIRQSGSFTINIKYIEKNICAFQYKIHILFKMTYYIIYMQYMVYYI